MKKTIQIIITLFIVNGAHSQAIYLEKNNVSGVIGRDGMLFHHEGNGSAGYEVPKGSGLNTIYSLRTWFGAQDINGIVHCSTHNADSIKDFSSGPVAHFNNYTSSAYLDQYFESVWKVTHAEIVEHNLNYQNSNYVIPESIANWPGNGDVVLGVAYDLAPFVDVDGDGVYNPVYGDYPDIRGDEAVFLIYNDHSNPDKLGVEIHVMLYQYSAGNYVNNTTFLNYKVYNRSTLSYFNYKQTIFLDGDLGNFSDDYVGCDVTNNIGYFYNGDNFDEDNAGSMGYHDNPPCQGLISLSHDMESFGYFTGSTAFPYTNPNGHSEYWNFMNARWADGSPWFYGGLIGTIPTIFMFPGDSDPTNLGTAGVDMGYDWTEYNTSLGSNPPGDRRIVMTIGNEELPAGGVICSDYALMTSFSGGSALGNIQTLRNEAAALQYLYDDGGFPCQTNQFTALEEESKNFFKISPNPSNGKFEIQLSEKMNDIEVIVTDVFGKVVLFKHFENSENISLNVYKPSGVYFVRINSSTYQHTEKLVIQ